MPRFPLHTDTLTARDIERAHSLARKRARADKHAELTFRSNPANTIDTHPIFSGGTR